MNETQAGRWTDKLLTRTSHPYFLHYSADGELHTCTVFPGPTLAEVEVTGYPDDWDLAGDVCAQFVAAVAADPHDGYLAADPDDVLSAASVGLLPAELEFASQVEYEPNVFANISEAVLAEWSREDSLEAAADDRVESRRIITVRLRQLSTRFPMLQRAGFGGMIGELSDLLNGDADEFDSARAEQLLASLECGATTPSGNYY